MQEKSNLVVNPDNNDNKSHIKKDENQKELLLVILISIIPGLIFPFLRTFSLLFPLIYYFYDKKKYDRDWAEIGFPEIKIIKDVKIFWKWILLVSIISQLFFLLISVLIIPTLFQHVIDRLPLITGKLDIFSITFLYISMIFTTLGEEIVYRSYFQDHLSKFYGNRLSIFIISLIFAAIHWSNGLFLVIFADLILIFFDSIIFGIIYTKSHNVKLCWLAHFCGNIFSFTMILAINSILP